jgi:hypothetical protein
LAAAPATLSLSIFPESPTSPSPPADDCPEPSQTRPRVASARAHHLPKADPSLLPPCDSSRYGASASILSRPALGAARTPLSSASLGAGTVVEWMVTPG